MPLDIPTNSQEVIERAKTDVQRSLPGSNPFLPNSVLGAIVTASASRNFDFYTQLDLMPDILLPDTSEDQFLERWAATFGKIRLAATTSTGNVIATGTLASNVPIATVMASSEGLIYEVTATVPIIAVNNSIVSIVRTGTIATVVTSIDHSLSSAVLVTITGADQPEYNVIGSSIIVLGPTSFTYTVAGSPITPATGTIAADYESAVVPVISQEFQDSENDVNVNRGSGEVLTLQAPLVGIDNDLLVSSGGVEGGSDQETDDLLRSRTLDKIQNPTAHFNVSDITEKAKEVNGVTRVFVEEITPDVGQVTIYFMRDNDDDPIPSGSEVTTTKDQILTIKPANTSDDDVIVLAPIASVTNFIFTVLAPNTPQMQSAITANLQQFFAEETGVSVGIDQDAYRAAIQNTIDIETGARVENFVLSTPVGDISISTGEIGTLGTVTYP